MFEMFTEGARRAIYAAREEARRYGSAFIGTEHLLLGVVAAGELAEPLGAVGLTEDRIRKEIERMVQHTGQPIATLGQIPFSPRAKRVLELSQEAASQLGHDVIGTEHLLLGLLRENEGIAPMLLQNLGVSLDDLRGRVVATLEGRPREPGLFDQVAVARKLGVELAEEAVRRLKANPERESDPLKGVLLSQYGKGALGAAAEAAASQGRSAVETQDLLAVLVESFLPGPIVESLMEGARDPEIIELGAEFKRLTAEKEQAISEQYFERAAKLRDDAVAARKRREERFKTLVSQRHAEEAAPPGVQYSPDTALALAIAAGYPRSGELAPSHLLLGLATHTSGNAGRTLAALGVDTLAVVGVLLRLARRGGA